MKNPFRKKTMVEKIVQTLTPGSRRTDRTVVRSGLAAAGAVAAVTAASAVVSAVRSRKAGEGDDART